MAISRGLRKKSKAKAELEAKKKALALANPAPARRKKKKHKSYSDSSVGGVRLRHIRKPVRNRAIQRQKRQAIKEKKRLKKQQHKVQEKVKVKAPRTKQDDTDVIDVTPSNPSVEVTPSEPAPSESKPMTPEDIERLRQYESNDDADEEKRKAEEEDTSEDSPWTDPEDEWRKQWLAGKEAENDAISEAPKNYIDDVMYSTFDALLTEMGAFDATLQDIVHQSIEMYGFTEAMNRLEAHLPDLYGRNPAFDIPLNHNDPVLKGIARFIKDMWGRPMSLAESEMYERKLDYLWTDPAYNNR